MIKKYIYQFFFSFLRELCKNVCKGLDARLEVGKRSEQDQKDLMEAHERKIDLLSCECLQVSIV